jgi:hypothetical protein
MKNWNAFLMVAILTTPLSAWAWGRRGHETIGVAATYLAAGEENTALKGHSFDIGWYCNVPDILWKRPATYESEKPQHFMDLEIFERAFKAHPEIPKPFELSRKEFEAKFPEIDAHAGRAFWRIRELDEMMNKAGETLRAQKEPKGKEYQALMEKWMTTAGLLCHYVGDLSMPLHVTENYDGKLTGQSGIHAFFEDTCVDLMYPKLADKVFSSAKLQWKGFADKNKNKTPVEMLETLTAGSNAEVKNLLAIDKASQRKETAKTCAKYEKMITARMTQSALVLAELYRRSLGWTFDDDKFFFFANDLAYIPPGEPISSPVTK